MNYPFLSESPDGVKITLHVQPKASKSAIGGVHGDALKLRIQAPPVEGKANKATIAFLSSLFDIPKRDIVLKSGPSSRRKIFLISGITLDQAKKILEEKL